LRLGSGGRDVQELQRTRVGPSKVFQETLEKYDLVGLANADGTSFRPSNMVQQLERDCDGSQPRFALQNWLTAAESLR
jgi:hypothetical protein